MADAYLGIGIELRIGGTAIPGCMSFSGPGQTRDVIDVTSHSTTGGYRQFISGLRDGGEITFDLNWLFTDATQLALETAYDADLAEEFEMYFPQVATNNLLTFDGLVTDMSWTGPTDAQITRSVTIKVTGAIAVTSEA
jgi:predicted secreted protein